MYMQWLSCDGQKLEFDQVWSMFSFLDEAPDEDALGRRARKKQRTRQAVLHSARRLMSSSGFEATTMQAVADDADVSAASLYNYFPTKQQLLLAVIGDACGALVVAGARVVARPPARPRVAIRRLLQAYLDGLCEVDRDLLRTAFGVSFSEPPERSESLIALDLTLMGQLQSLVARFQSSGDVDAQVDPQSAALALYGTFSMTVMAWLSLPRPEAERWRGLLDAQLEIVFRGLDPRAAP